MKKIIAVVMIMLFMPVYVFAQGARNASGPSIAQVRTNFSNIGVMGLAVDGNPGFIAMTGVVRPGTEYLPEYYLWVDIDGDLCMTSLPTVTNDLNSNFPNGDWSPAGGTITCTKVGGQS